MPTKRLLALDVASSTTGWAVVDAGSKITRDSVINLVAHGKFSFPAKWKRGDKLVEFEIKLQTLYKAHKPDLFVIETPFIRQIPAAKVLFRFVGVAELIARINTGKDALEIDASKTRSILACKGKEGVQEMVNRKFGLELGPDDLDVSDAIGLALAAVTQLRKGKP